jgi:hypothetical protein
VKKKIVISLIGIALLLLVLSISFLVPETKRTDKIEESRSQKVEAFCRNARNTGAGTVDSEVNGLIYKTEGQSPYFNVYVQPSWYLLAFDVKETFAGFVAECKLKGSVTFLDSRTGKRLAYWGNNGRYENYQK